MKRILTVSFAVLFLGAASAWAGKAMGKGGVEGDAKDTEKGMKSIKKLSVPGMTADSQGKIEKALTAVEGVKKVKSDPDKKTVTVIGDSGAKLDADKLIAVLKEAGFDGATEAKAGGKGADKAQKEE